MSAGIGMLARLRVIAKERGASTEHVLTRWVAERFLARLSASEHAGRLTLKGGFLFALWQGDLMRTTADVDLHGEEADMASMQAMLTSIVASGGNDDEDGVVFDVTEARFSGLSGGRLPGLRMTVPTAVGSARPRLKVDIGYGHPITPGAELGWYPSSVPGFASFPIRAYPRATVIAEKLAVAVEFGRDNTRLRDYYDLWFLSQRYSYFGHVLREAVARTFAARDAGRFVERTDGYWEQAFAEEFASNHRERAWGNWLDEHAPTVRAPDLRRVVGEVAAFGMPVLAAVRGGRALNQRWSPDGGWRSMYGTPGRKRASCPRLTAASLQGCRT